MQLSSSTQFPQPILTRLQNEPIIWLTTSGSDGTPQPRPVWFWWDGATFLIFSQPGAYKLKHIARFANVALNFNSTVDGDDVVVFTGKALIDPEPVPAEQVDGYLRKYAEGIPAIGMTPESYLARFSAVIWVTPTKVRGVDVL